MNSTSEKHLIVRDRVTGLPVAIPTSSIPVEIRPSTWYENAYWMHCSDRAWLEPIIMKYLKDRDLNPDEVRELARYLVDFACHIAVMGYIFWPESDAYAFNVECIRRLRLLQERASTREDVAAMIRIGRHYALDPL